MKHIQACVHSAQTIRPTIGAKSGILCGLCGQDVPTSTAINLILLEMQSMSQKIADLAKHSKASECTDCGRLHSPEYQFHGIKRKSVCLACLEKWFDNENGDINDMNVSYLAEFMLRHDIRIAGNRSRLAEMAFQAFPDKLPQAIKSKMR